MSVLVEEVRRDLLAEMEGRKIEWQVGALPTVFADVVMLKMAIRNLLSNALKYSRHREVAVIKVNATDGPYEEIFSISDNGVGFDMQYVDKLFGVFQRLHRIEDFEGT